MSKKTIIERAKETPEAPQNRASQAKSGSGSTATDWAAKIADEISERLCKRLEALLPICARLAAADTLHTTERESTVLRRAIEEGVRAAGMLKEVTDGRDA